MQLWGGIWQFDNITPHLLAAFIGLCALLIHLATLQFLLYFPNKWFDIPWNCPEELFPVEAEYDKIIAMMIRFEICIFIYPNKKYRDIGQMFKVGPRDPFTPNYPIAEFWSPPNSLDSHHHLHHFTPPL